MTVSVSQRSWMNGSSAVPKRSCRGCGALFFTGVGLAEHTRLGCGNGHGSPVTVRRLWRTFSPEGRARLQETGRHVTALNNSRRVQCGECGKVSTPAAIGVHQKYSGHSGRVELS